MIVLVIRMFTVSNNCGSRNRRAIVAPIVIVAELGKSKRNIYGVSKSKSNRNGTSKSNSSSGSRSKSKSKSTSRRIRIVMVIALVVIAQ